ncbi:MAG TPA: potassium channel family protein, partial [Actinomycetota bacterium]|nr:potassium channel family protein [Actinomycetota bacterium]
MQAGERHSSDAFARYSRTSDGPLTFLALAMVPLLVIPLTAELSDAWETAILAADYLIWAVFTIDYLIRLYLSPSRRQFVRRHIPDLIIVLVPFLRPLRIMRSARVLRLLRLGRVLAFAGKGISELRAILSSRGLNYVLLLVVLLLFLSALVVFEVERGVEGSNIDSYADALWWAVTTTTTVGYGDRFPVSPAGRGVAVLLMLSGIALF